MRRSAGYTLLELILVMAVLAVASLVVTPAVGRALDGIRVRADVAGVASLLRWAREQAATQGQAREVVFDDRERALVVRRAAGGSTGAVERRRPLSSRVAVAPPPGGLLAPITFMPMGLSNGGSLRLEAGPRVYVVTVDALTGRVSTKRVDS
ncbi:MAG TPA: GspH/FimT family pseudopilin [Methylomirabilota bacterium]|nr:GspH/FimT family pseudopilin [Methylomirabilota bacterium]